MKGGEGYDKIEGGEGNDIITGDAGRDYIDGGLGNDNLAGGEDNDILIGGDGNDIITGDNGNDIITGDNGNDVIIGGSGADQLTGGAGSDTYVYITVNDSSVAAPDKINDFETGIDKINLNSLKQFNNEEVEIKKVVNFTRKINELLLDYNENTNVTNLKLDHDGNGQAEFNIEIIGKVDFEQDIITSEL
ncbi:M10 family metallopeptidase C-terminal domain-containing protein [Arsenophonus apicola]|nr:M10 family metallopeptidase C-terminal domain-containing protein [Arsenophonus endosymbiont of Apis mellifera]UBX30488.1 M10 family metallopeptidase C-terminal domain-containing protein [Arsenophonus apicola]